MGTPIIDLSNLPGLRLEAELPQIHLKSIHFQNFKAFENFELKFDNGPFSCFIGPNGCGKSTVLDAIQMIFSKFEGYEDDRLKALLGKSVRHVDGKQNGVYGDDDFLITAKIESPELSYEVQINKMGFIKDHPQEVKDIHYRLCFYARFDQELHQFQLNRSKWGVFKELFESVTGFEIEEKKSIFDDGDDPIQKNILGEYVVGFMVHKPHETIAHNECSAGERKIIKSFSTLLNKEIKPSIILIDNVAMHVESGRHLELIKSLKKCFPNSQLFTTTHSYHISRNLGSRDQIYDLRFIHLPDFICSEKWRIYIADEIEDNIFKLRSLVGDEEVTHTAIEAGEKLLKEYFSENCNRLTLANDTKSFMHKAADLFIDDMFNFYGSE